MDAFVQKFVRQHLNSIQHLQDDLVNTVRMERSLDSVELLSIHCIWNSREKCMLMFCKQDFVFCVSKCMDCFEYKIWVLHSKTDPTKCTIYYFNVIQFCSIQRVLSNFTVVSKFWKRRQLLKMSKFVNFLLCQTSSNFKIATFENVHFNKNAISFVSG